MFLNPNPITNPVELGITSNLSSPKTKAVLNPAHPTISVIFSKDKWYFLILKIYPNNIK